MSARRGVMIAKQWIADDPGTIVISGMGLGRELEQIRKQWPKSRVICAEPFQHTIDAVIKRGAMECVDQCVPVAIWSHKCTLGMVFGGEKSAVVQSRGVSVKDSITCDAITLDELRVDTSPWPEPVLLWLDCEGSELEALRGMTTSPRWINVEMVWQSLPHHAMDQLTLQTYLTQRGYRLFGIHGVGRGGGGGDGFFIRQNEYEEIAERFRKAQAKVISRRHRRLMKRLNGEIK